MSISGGVDEEGVVQKYSGMSPSHRKEWNCAIYIDVDGVKDCHTEWSKSEREKQIYLNTYMWNLEKWYRWSYLQSRNRDTDVESICTDIKGERGGRLGLIYTLLVPCVKQITHDNILYSLWYRELCLRDCGDLHGKESSRGGDVCICTADSLCCAVETQHWKATELQ